MSSRPSHPPARPQAESGPDRIAEPDLDGTAELPVLDPADAGTPERVQSGGGNLAPSAGAASGADAAAAARQRLLQADLESAAARLREAQELLASKGERLGQLERARDEERSAHEVTQQRLAAIVAELAARQAELARQGGQLAEAQHALEEAQRARADSEQRAADAGTELALARELVSTSRAESTQALAQVESQQADSRAAGERLVEDLEFERTRCLTYLEALQTGEAARQMAAGLAEDLERELEARAEELERLGRELAARDARVRELEAGLGEQRALGQRLEQQSSSRETLLAERDTQLGESRQARQDLEADLARVQAELAAANERLRALEGSAEQERQGSSQLHGELERLRGERAELDIALAAARTAAADAEAEVSARKKALAAEHARVAELETTLTEERQRAEGLDDELSTTRDEMAEWSGVLKTLQQQRNEQLAGSSASEARVRELERELAGQRATAAALKAEGEGRAIRVRELEADLRAAEDTVHRLESELRNRSAHAAELTRSPPGQRREEAPASAADATMVDARSPEARQAADGSARLLIRDDGGRELVHMLGRKTSIGRTADNDLQIDAKFISRHHAVILAGPAQTIIEDLNSTNGVLVNGRRITRQILNDGDQVTIGRALYRFAVRRSGEKR